MEKPDLKIIEQAPFYFNVVGAYLIPTRIAAPKSIIQIASIPRKQNVYQESGFFPIFLSIPSLWYFFLSY